MESLFTPQEWETTQIRYRQALETLSGTPGRNRAASFVSGRRGETGPVLCSGQYASQ